MDKSIKSNQECIKWKWTTWLTKDLIGKQIRNGDKTEYTLK